MGIYDSLNNMQKQAVITTEGPLLILAGAGSGKTRVLTHRIAYLIDEKKVNPWNIMAITFTNKAAAEMRTRVDDLVGFGSESIWVATFHSSCVRILRRYIDRLGYQNNFTIYDADDQKTVVKEICRRLDFDTKILKEKRILSEISSAKDECISPKEYELENGSDYTKKQIAKVYYEYQKQLFKSNALDFDDLLVKTVELFEMHKDVLESYQERFKYIMVDEYQDTNTVQFKFINLLAGKYKNLCVVGDDDQSIYKFRGANIKNILDFEMYYDNTTVIKLEQNYRSTKRILEAANSVIRNNIGRKEKALWSELPDGDKIKLVQANDAYEEAVAIGNEIRDAVIHGDNYNDCACLYRTNAQSRAIEEVFIKMSIPYRIFGGVNFYARKEVKDMLAYLKTISNGNDEVAVKRIINIPKRGIGAATINKIAAYASDNDITFYEALTKSADILGPGRSSAKVLEFVNLIQMFKSKVEYISIKELIDNVIEVTEYVKELEADQTEESESRIDNVNELVSKIADYEQSADEKPTLASFLEEVSLVADIDNLDETKNFVKMMTIHSAKGLEFDRVFLTGMEEGLFPGYKTTGSDNNDDLEEERRLCYVAITRAKKHLMISSAKQRMLRGETQYNVISRFVKEIPMGILETAMNEKELKKSTVVKPSETSNAKPILKTKAYDPAKYTVQKIDTLDYAVGDRVKHIKFGEGTVATIVDGGKDYEVTVDFDSAGTKKMFASFAKLKKL